jgi:predicted enzyme related to lactoylglutathione lyase
LLTEHEIQGDFQMAEQKPANGTFCWNELMTRDVAGASKFYTELLGWKAVDSGMSGPPYTLFKADDKDAGGMMEMPAEIPKEVPSHWMAYITVDDVDSLVDKVKDMGGQILHGPQDVPDVGRFIVIQDPAGAVVSLIKMA